MTRSLKAAQRTTALPPPTLSSLEQLLGDRLTLVQPRPHDPLQPQGYEGSLASRTHAETTRPASNAANSLQTVNRVRSSTTTKLLAVQPFGCVIRRFSALSDTNTHFVPPVRGASVEKRNRKAAVEKLLVDCLGLAQEGFKLDSLNNLCRMGADLQRQMDGFGTFFLAPSQEDMAGMLVALHAANENWQASSSTGRSMDPGFRASASVRRLQLEMHPLYPDVIVPAPGAFTYADSSHGVYCHVQGNDIVRMDNNEPFPLLDMSRESDHLNPFMVIIKAHAIIFRFARLHPERLAQLPQRVISAARTVSEIYDLMMYCPDGHRLDPLIVDEAQPGPRGGQPSPDDPLKVASSYTAEELAAQLPPPVHTESGEGMGLGEGAEDINSVQSSPSQETTAHASPTERRSIMEAVLGQDVPGAVQEGTRTAVPADPGALIEAEYRRRQALGEIES